MNTKGRNFQNTTISQNIEEDHIWEFYPYLYTNNSGQKPEVLESGRKYGGAGVLSKHALQRSQKRIHVWWTPSLGD